MGVESLNDNKIEELIKLPKRVTNPNVREKVKGKHTEKNYNVSDNADDLSFSLFLRQNLLIEDDFSCGLVWNMPSGETVTLVRYNGGSHAHRNHLEGELLDRVCHVHKASEKYLLAGKKLEGYARAANQYWTLQGALHCLLTDCNINGLTSNPDQPKLFQ